MRSTRARLFRSAAIGTLLCATLLAPSMALAQADETDPDDLDAPTSGPVHNLSGTWKDNAYEIVIVQSGSSVQGIYTTQYDCDHRDGTGNHSYTDQDFEGELSGNTITGTTSVCRYGSGNNPGILTADVKLTVNAADTALTGNWKSPQASGSVSITRQGCAPRSAADYGLPDHGTSAPYHQLRLYRKPAGATSWQYVRDVGDNEAVVPAANEKVAPHEGTDYRSRNDQDQVANLPFTTPVSGTVEVVPNSPYNAVGVRTADGGLIQFLHASSLSVVNGQDVSAGDQLGVTGNTAPYSVGIHLHVQAEDSSGNHVNPDCVTAG